MLVLISPAKSLREAPSHDLSATMPRLMEHTEKVVKKMKSLSKPKLKKLMSISDQLAAENQQRFKEFELEHSHENAQQAVHTFDGDVYKGMETENWDKSTEAYAQDHLRILSGLYGLLRPADLIQPYRLEMGTRINIGRRKNLYDFWTEDVTDLLLQDIGTTQPKVLLNLASNEYWKAIDEKRIPIPIVKANFKEWRNGEYKFISFNAKRARGLMANYVLQNQIETIEDLKGFDTDGYMYNEDLSKENQLIFTKN